MLDYLFTDNVSLMDAKGRIVSATSPLSHPIFSTDCRDTGTDWGQRFTAREARPVCTTVQQPCCVPALSVQLSRRTAESLFWICYISHVRKKAVHEMRAGARKRLTFASLEVNNASSMPKTQPHRCIISYQSLDTWQILQKCLHIGHLNASWEITRIKL